MTDTLDLAKYDGIDFTPAEGVRAAYRNGLKRHEDGETGDGLEPETVAQARRFADGEATSPEWARKGNRWWGRNARFADEEPGSPAYAAAQLWGGRNWFAPIVASMDKVDAEMAAVFDVADSTVLLSNFDFVELNENMMADKAFDGLVAGEFTDMHGRTVKISRADLAAMVANTTTLLESTRTESGELAGLPIDELQHNKGHASGWIVGVELVGDVLRIIPQWTELGRDLIAKKIQRYFSATVDLAKKVIYGGTLTNWPATRDNKTGRVLLRPIELSEQATAENGTPAPIETPMENKIMTVELTQEVQDLISAKISEGIAASLAAMPKPETPPASLDFSKMVDVLDLDTEEAEKQNLAHLRELAKMMQDKANLHFKHILAEQARENKYTELATKVTGGTTEYPRALPVTTEALREALLKLPAEQAKFWMELCENIVRSGLTEFSEIGHGRNKKQGTKILEPKIAATLKEHVNAGGEIAAWFELAELGAMDDYDLSAFEKGK